MWCEQYIECITSIWHLRKKSLHMGKNWQVSHISCHNFNFNSWYLHLLVYYKYMLNFQWRLFCILDFGVTFFKLLHIKTWHELPLHMIFLCYSKGVFEYTFDIFTKFSHVICDLFRCKSKIYHVLNSLYVDDHNLNVRCIETNIFYNGFLGMEGSCTCMNMAIKLNYMH
jgi:hypothetical protein